MVLKANVINKLKGQWLILESPVNLINMSLEYQCQLMYSKHSFENIATEIKNSKLVTNVRYIKQCMRYDSERGGLYIDSKYLIFKYISEE